MILNGFQKNIFHRRRHHRHHRRYHHRRHHRRRHHRRRHRRKEGGHCSESVVFMQFFWPDDSSENQSINVEDDFCSSLLTFPF